MMNRVGQRMGNYRLLRLLGQGGFADVYLGEHLFLKTPAAIKILHRRLSHDDLQSFLEEARIIAGLLHPNIVRVLEFGVEGNQGAIEESILKTESGLPFLVMDYAPNGILRRRFAKGAQFPPATFLPYVKQAAAALQYAHEKKLIHRDVKPENMLVGRNNEVLLSDFGLALVTQSSHFRSAQEIAGTVAYMAPEQLQGQPRRASDQYSLGIVVYEWLCGERPFHGTFTEVFSQHLHVPPPSLRQKVPAISSEVEEVVMTALAKDPEKRFASVQAFANALEQASRQQAFPSSNPTVAPQSFTNFPSSTAANYIPLIIAPSIESAYESSHTRAPISSNSPFSNASMPTPYMLSPTEPIHSPESKAEPTHRFSRRAALVGIGATALALAGGSIAWLAYSRTSTPTPHGETALPLGKTLVVYTGHSGPVYGLKWSPDGNRIASVGADNTVQVWDATNGHHILTYHGHQRSTNGVAWLPGSGMRIASASADNTVQVWDWATGKTLLTYREHHNNVRALTWSPDGSYLASGGDDKTVKVWNAITGQTLFTYAKHSDFIWYIMWSPDGTKIASGSQDTTAQVCNATRGMSLVTYTHHSKGVKALTWSPDSKQIASVSDDLTAQVWDAHTGAHLFTYGGPADQSISWSPDGKHIASSSADVQVWDAHTGKHSFTYSEHLATVHGIAWSPDGSRIASASDDKTVRVWQAI
jgi:eukaryotic-like serine/threonine-protein kinase